MRVAFFLWFNIYKLDIGQSSWSFYRDKIYRELASWIDSKKDLGLLGEE
ncbi:hypothetical protein Javan639_0032 [Streptococcus phage Javan639]|jgi:hypothetical protein|nr:hypothetical protein Javan639_0032 [Streptococcus phage Javan639]QBX22719.1 hypothetical protein Javan95_0011 [Streptococcus phage Javan95]